MVLRLAAEPGYSPESPGEAARLLVDEGFLTEEEYEFVGSVVGSGMYSSTPTPALIWAWRGG